MSTALRQQFFKSDNDRCDSMKSVKDLVVPDPTVPVRNSTTSDRFL